MHVDHVGLSLVFHHQVTCGLHEMGLAKPDTAVKKQWVVCFTGIFPDLTGGGPSQLVGFAADMGIEGEGWIQSALKTQRPDARPLDGLPPPLT